MFTAESGDKRMPRSTEEVLHDHLELRRIGDLDTDLARNYAESSVLLCRYGVSEGHNAIRGSAQLLALQLPAVRFEYLACITHGESGFLEWRAESPDALIEDGADSYLIRDGLILVQTIHYTLIPR